MEISFFSLANPLFLWPFSIVMLNYQRVDLLFFETKYVCMYINICIHILKDVRILYNSYDFKVLSSIFSGSNMDFTWYLTFTMGSLAVLQLQLAPAIGNRWIPLDACVSMPG